MRFKFISRNTSDIDEIHVWDFTGALSSLTLEFLKSAIQDLFVVPTESIARLTWFDGEDLITISTTGQLTHILRDVSSRAVPFSGQFSVRIEVQLKSTPTSFGNINYRDLPPRPAFAIPAFKTPICDKCTQTELPSHSIFSDFLNENVICDGCDEDLYGIRYKCLICGDFDLCTSCFINFHHKDHAFVAIRPPPAINKASFEVFDALRMVKVAAASNMPQERVPSPDNDPQGESVSDASPEWELVSDSEDDVSLIHNPTEFEGSPVIQEKSETIELDLPQYDEFEEAHALVVNTEPAFGRATLVNSCTSPQFASQVTIQSPSDTNEELNHTPAAIGSNLDEKGNVRSTSGTSCTCAAASTPPSQAPTTLGEEISLHNIVLEAFRKLGIVHSPEGSVDQLQLLLDKGYTNDGGILTFLLGENNNSAAAVIEILKSQRDN